MFTYNAFLFHDDLNIFSMNIDMNLLDVENIDNTILLNHNFAYSVNLKMLQITLCKYNLISTDIVYQVLYQTRI